MDNDHKVLLLFENSLKDKKTVMKDVEIGICGSGQIEKIFERRICQRCEQKQAEYECRNCSVSVLCIECERLVHSFSKFVFHNRQVLNLGQLGRQKGMKSSMFVQDENGMNLNVNMGLNMNRKWDQIIYRIGQRFKQVMNVLEDKREQIMNKILLKKNQEIEFYKNSCLKLEKGCNRKEMMSIGKNNYKGFECLDIFKKNKVVFGIFNEIQGLIGKMQIRNILTSVEQENNIQTVKKSMKGSLVMGSCVSSTASPRNKTPRNGKSWLSQSTMDVDSRFSFERMNQKIMMKSPMKQGIGLLNKVRSQKLFGKYQRNQEKGGRFKMVKECKNGIMI